MGQIVLPSAIELSDFHSPDCHRCCCGHRRNQEPIRTGLVELGDKRASITSLNAMDIDVFAYPSFFPFLASVPGCYDAAKSIGLKGTAK
jgi:hypothetical protein